VGVRGLVQRVMASVAAVAAAVGCAGPGLRTGGLDDVRERGELRVVVRPGFLDDRGGPAPAEEAHARLMAQLATRLGATLRWVPADRHDQVVRWLVDGRGDLAAGRLSPATLLDTGAVPTTAVEWVEDLLVGSATGSYASLGSVAGARVHVHPSRLDARLRASLAEEGLEVAPVPEEVPIEEVLRRVVRGRYVLAVADSDLVRRSRWARQLRVLGPLAERRPLVWAVRRTNPRLRAAVDDFLFAEEVLARGSRTTACRDLDAIRAAGVLRLVTRNSPTTCTVDRGGLRGFEYELVTAFARRIGVRLDLAIPPPGQDVVAWLEGGFGDLAAVHEPAPPSVEGRVRVSPWYRRVPLVAVTRAAGDRGPATLDELAGRQVVASAAVAELVELLPLDPAVTARTVPPTGDALAALSEVSRGRADVAVVDGDTARLELEEREGLREAFTVLPSVDLVWLSNPSAPELSREIAAFLRQARRSGLVRQLVLSQLGRWSPYVPLRLPEVPEGALTPYDELLKWEARRNGIDWRLLASLMYEESRFDPQAVGPGGSAGLFQLMPFTWRELGVEDPHHPAEAAAAATAYLRRLMEYFDEVPLADRVAMAIASYNVGPRHVFDARRLAAEMGLDPDRWRGNVETAMVLLDDPEVARAFPAGVCRCRRAVGYTRRILRRYQAYAEVFPPA